MVGGALAEDGAADACTAGGTGLAGAVINAEVLAEIARRSVLAQEIAQGRAALANRVFEHVPDGVRQSGQALGCDARGRPGGVDSGHKEGFAGVDVADADHGARVHQSFFDGTAAPGAGGFEAGAVECTVEGFGPEVVQQRVFGGIGFGP